MKQMNFDAVIVGAGGAGLRAALQLAQSNYKVAVISKVYPTRFAHRFSSRWYCRGLRVMSLKIIGNGTCTIPSTVRIT